MVKFSYETLIEIKSLWENIKTETDFKAGIDCFLDEQQHYKKEMYDPNQGDRIIPVEITHNLTRRFFSYFWGRMDVYSKRFQNKISNQDSIAKMLKGNREFIMLDEQKVVYEEILNESRQSVQDDKKRVVIVKGGPGTGKSEGKK